MFGAKTILSKVLDKCYFYVKNSWSFTTPTKIIEPIIKEELRFEENLKKRLEFICEFSKVTPTFVNGSIRKIEKTNISYIEPHRVIVKDKTFLVFNYSNDVYISNLAKKIKLSELESYINSIK